MSLESVTLEQLNPVIGTEVRGLDLSVLDDAKAGWLRSLLAERRVLVVRDQHLDREQHKAIARLFGAEVRPHDCCRRSTNIIAAGTGQYYQYSKGDGNG